MKRLLHLGLQGRIDDDVVAEFQFQFVIFFDGVARAALHRQILGLLLELKEVVSIRLFPIGDALGLREVVDQTANERDGGDDAPRRAAAAWGAIFVAAVFLRRAPFAARTRELLHVVGAE